MSKAKEQLVATNQSSKNDELSLQSSENESEEDLNSDLNGSSHSQKLNGVKNGTNGKAGLQSASIELIKKEVPELEKMLKEMELNLSQL